MHENALLPLILRTFIMYFVKPQFIMDHQDNNDTPELFYWMENGITTWSQTRWIAASIEWRRAKKEIHFCHWLTWRLLHSLSENEKNKD